MMEDPEIEALSRMMEEMANQPREPLGERISGERGMYERTMPFKPTEKATGEFL